MPPHVIIADADRWTADLLAQLVGSVRPDARIEQLADAHSVLERCRRLLPDLLIADRGLPGDGLELLREVRKLRPRPPLPFLLISEKVDTQSVRQALALAPTAYLARPFHVEDLLQRLRQVLLPDGVPAPAAPVRPTEKSLEQHLGAAREQSGGAPLLENVQRVLQRCLDSKEDDLDELEQLFRQDPQLTARLIAAANSAAQHCGSNCQTLGQALARLGLLHSLNLALGLALERCVSLADPQLQAPGLRIWSQAQRVAKLSHWLALLLEAEAERCYTAGLLHLLGDLAVLRSIQDWRDQGGGELSPTQVEAALKVHAAPFGSALRTRWRLPLELRQLIAATFQLGSGVHSREGLIMHLAHLAAALPEGADPRSLANTKAAHMLNLGPSLLGSLPNLSALI